MSATDSGSKPISAYAAYLNSKQQQQAQEAAMEAVPEAKHTDEPIRAKKRLNKHSLSQPSSATNGSKKAKLAEKSPANQAQNLSSVTNSSQKAKQPDKQASANGSESRTAPPAIRPGKKAWRNQKRKHVQSSQQMQAPVSMGSGQSVSEESDSSVIDPVVEATEVFKEIIDPVTTEEFFATYWERKPLLIKRGAPGHYVDWFSSQDLDCMLRTQRVMFGEHLDVTSYRDGKRETHNPDGRALPGQVWQFYRSGCSLRLLCPQVFHERVYQKLSILHELFGAFVGANVYLTPPGTQGFAPHWDDIEAFVMQLEGRKHWRVYAPRRPEERLPRESSGNFGAKDRLGQPIIDAVLEPGDLLYMPRGFIHQGRCLDAWHSLHITVSTYQKFAWADLLSEALSEALDRAARQDVEFRRGLPLGLLGYAGCAFTASSSGGGGREEANLRRRQAEEMCRSLLARLAGHVSLDDAADRLACQQVRDALPPALDPTEVARSAHGGGPVWDARRCRLTASTPGGPPPSLTGASRVRFIRRSAARLTRSGRLHTSLGNTRVFREVEPAFLEVEAPLAPGVAALASAYPEFLAVGKLPVADPEERLDLAVSLYEGGLLVTEDLPSLR